MANNNLPRMDETNFIQHFRAIHGNNYDYSKFVYTGSMKKGIIICATHGEFEQDPNNHKKSGCSLCDNKGKRPKYFSVGLFRERALEKYAGKFLYPGLLGKLANEKLGKKAVISIMCTLHNETYNQMVENHLEKTDGGCPKCANLGRATSNYDPDKGKNLTQFPGLADKIRWWCYERNVKGPECYPRTSKEKVWWICPECPNDPEHIHEMNVCNKIYIGQDCPVCMNVKVAPGQNSLSTAKDFDKHWDSALNPGVDPTREPKAANRVYRFRCDVNRDHVFAMRGSNFYNGERCGICAGKSVDATNSVATVYPELVKYWNALKNDKEPEEVSYGSGLPVWWDCPYVDTHVYPLQPNLRSKSVCCPECVRSGYSMISIEWLHCIERKYGLKIQHALQWGEMKVPVNGKNYRADGYVEIGDTKIVLEFNGDLWHGNPAVFAPDTMCYFLKKTFGQLHAKTLKKEADLVCAGYTVISIWERDFRDNYNNYMNLDFEIPEIELYLATKDLEDIKL